ncbi:flagellar basal body P-ring formation protein FlgA [bacterium]|nr:flagellar basal body P-ring formation protein FlgA [bacterium]
MRLFGKQSLPAGFYFQVASLCLLLFLFSVPVLAVEPESLLQRCQLEIETAVAKELAGIEDLQVEGLGDIERWLSGSSVGSRVSVLQVGCWNRRNGVVPVQLGLVLDGGRESRRWFKVRVRGQERVLLAQRDLSRGEPVRRIDFVSQLVDCQSLKHEVLNYISPTMVYQLTCNLKAGAPLPAKRLKSFRMIKRGELVHVALDLGGVKVSTRGVAMGNGALQDIITVKNPSSKKYYQARVVAPGEVVVAY